MTQYQTPDELSRSRESRGWGGTESQSAVPVDRRTEPLQAAISGNANITQTTDYQQ